MVREAADRIRPLARRTPVMTSRSVDARSGCAVFFKCENFQRGGAFKIRGAANLVLSIPKEDLPRGVVAFSSGNHAQATAIAAKHVGAPATIVMPADDAPIEDGADPRPRRPHRHLRPLSRRPRGDCRQRCARKRRERSCLLSIIR
jgi:hypothetical protein